MSVAAARARLNESFAGIYCSSVAIVAIVALLAGAIPPGGETRGATVSIACSVTASLVRVTLATRGFADAPPAKGSDAVAARLDALYGGNGRLVTRVTTSREAETTIEFARE
jgi:hypothetical protein